MIAMLYATGAIAATPKRPSVFRTALASAPAARKIGAMSISRVSSTVIAVVSASKPGTSHGTMAGANTTMSDRQDEQCPEHQVRDARRDALGPRPLARGDEAGEHGDERRADRASRDELEHEVGDAERRVVRVEVRARAEHVAQDQDTDPAEDARDEERAGDGETGAREGAVGHGAASGPGRGGGSSGLVRARGWAAR